MRSPLENLQHQLPNTAANGNDCTSNQKPGPCPLRLPVGHGFADREHRDGRIRRIKGQQVGLHLGNQPNNNGKTGNHRGDLVGEGHIFPIHNNFPFLFEIADDKQNKSFNINTPQKSIWFRKIEKLYINFPTS